MERRQFIANTGIIAAGLTLASSSKTRAEGPSKPATAAPSALLIQDASALKMLGRFAETANHCALSGDVCIQHCTELLAKGETEMADCLVASQQMTVVCETVSKLANMKSVRLAEMLDACAAACKSCKEACEEHKAHFRHGMHMECKACAEHCEKMIAEVKKLKSALVKS